MSYYKNRNKRKLTSAQQLARLKRRQERERKQREARRELERQSLEPGGSRNPLTPKWIDFKKYPRVQLSYENRRYRGRTSVTAYAKGTEPAERTCLMMGYTKVIPISKEAYENYLRGVGCVRFGKRWYRHPITTVSYEEFCKRYVVVEHLDRYLD